MTTATAKTEKTEKPALKKANTREPRLPHGNLKPMNYYVRQWSAMIPASATWADIQEYSYWKNVSAQGLERGHIISCVSEGGSFFGQLVVVNAENQIGARVAVLSYVDLTEAERLLPSVRDDYEIRRGRASKWEVVRKKDGQIIRDLLDTRELAEIELTSAIAVASS